MKNINTKSISSISLSYILGKETHKSLSHCPYTSIVELWALYFVWYKWLPNVWSCVSISLQAMRLSKTFWWQEMALMLTWETICPVFAGCGQSGLLGSTDNTNRQYFMRGRRRGIPDRGGICLVNKSDGWCLVWVCSELSLVWTGSECGPSQPWAQPEPRVWPWWLVKHETCCWLSAWLLAKHTALMQTLNN